MAPRARRRRARGCRPSSGTLKGGRGQGTPDGFGPVSTLVTGWLPMTVRGGGVPEKPTASMPLCRMGPPPRSFRCDAHHCIMVWVFTHRIQGCGTNVRATTRGLPSDFVIPTTTSVPSCSNPSRTKPSRVALRAILDRFCARRPPHSVWVGARKRVVQVEQGN